MDRVESVSPLHEPSLLSGKTFIRYGNQRINATLSLSFSNITDADAVLILNNYKNSNEDWGTDTKYVEFDSSSETSPLAGASVDLKVYFKECRLIPRVIM